MSSKGYCGPDCVPVQSCRDGPLAICRILQAVLAGLLLFTGIVCQFWAGSNVNDIPLSNLCNAYSGSSEVMQAGDFSDLLDWWEESVLQCTSRRKCATFQGVLPPTHPSHFPSPLVPLSDKRCHGGMTLQRRWWACRIASCCSLDRSRSLSLTHSLSLARADSLFSLPPYLAPSLPHSLA
jgi:hypothetical protein